MQKITHLKTQITVKADQHKLFVLMDSNNHDVHSHFHSHDHGNAPCNYNLGPPHISTQHTYGDIWQAVRHEQKFDYVYWIEVYYNNINVHSRHVSLLSCMFTKGFNRAAFK